MEGLWKLIADSTIVQGVLTVGLWGVACYLMITGQTVPDMLVAGCGTILGYWFGVKTTAAIQSYAAQSRGQPNP